MNILVTGGAGFIGSQFLKYSLPSYSEDHFICLDALTYASHPDLMKDYERYDNFTFYQGSICDKPLVEELCEQFHIDSIIHFAAESHVDNSWNDDKPFIETNVRGTEILLDVALGKGLKRFHHVSTDEVYGHHEVDDEERFFTEASPLCPRNPYAATKAVSDLLVLNYGQSYDGIDENHWRGLYVTISRATNTYGPYQHREKLLPKAIYNASHGIDIPIYGDGQQEREWIHVDDHSCAIDCIFRNGVPSTVYNVGSQEIWKNKALISYLLEIMELDESLITHVEDRQQHDRAYGLDSSFIRRTLGWKPMRKMEDELANLVAHYKLK